MKNNFCTKRAFFWSLKLYSNSTQAGNSINIRSHVLLKVTYCFYVTPQFMFESAHKCCISCLWFSLRHEFQLVAPRAYQFLSAYPPGYFLPSVLMLILVPPKTSRAFSFPVRFMTSHDFIAFGLHPYLGTFQTFLIKGYLIWKNSQYIRCNMTLML